MVQLSELARMRSRCHAVGDAHLGDDLIAMSKQEWQQKAESQSFSWRAIFAEAVILYKHNS